MTIEYVPQEIIAQEILKDVSNCGDQFVVLTNSELITLISTSILSNLRTDSILALPKRPIFSLIRRSLQDKDQSSWHKEQ